MKGLREKFRGHGGFTLVEMLIVVAIPIVGNSLEKARHAVDDANERSAVGLGSVIYLADSKNAEGTYNYYVNATHQAKLVGDGEGDAVISECKCGEGHSGKSSPCQLARMA